MLDGGEKAEEKLKRVSTRIKKPHGESASVFYAVFLL